MLGIIREATTQRFERIAEAALHGAERDPGFRARLLIGLALTIDAFEHALLLLRQLAHGSPQLAGSRNCRIRYRPERERGLVVPDDGAALVAPACSLHPIDDLVAGDDADIAEERFWVAQSTRTGVGN